VIFDIDDGILFFPDKEINIPTGRNVDKVSWKIPTNNRAKKTTNRHAHWERNKDQLLDKTACSFLYLLLEPLPLL
jgi:hypothetical protein